MQRILNAYVCSQTTKKCKRYNASEVICIYFPPFLPLRHIMYFALIGCHAKKERLTQHQKNRTINGENWREEGIVHSHVRLTGLFSSQQWSVRNLL